jgi:hypothetical protein
MHSLIVSHPFPLRSSLFPRDRLERLEDQMGRTFRIRHSVSPAELVRSSLSLYTTMSSTVTQWKWTESRRMNVKAKALNNASLCYNPCGSGYCDTLLVSGTRVHGKKTEFSRL